MRRDRRHLWIAVDVNHRRTVGRQRGIQGRADLVRRVDDGALEPEALSESGVPHIGNHLRCLEFGRTAHGADIDGIVSVASFFISRVDSKVDDVLDELNLPDYKGTAAIANAKVAYDAYQRLYDTPRWDDLQSHGGTRQRQLWASTSPKNPDYPATYYVDALVGPDTVSTMKQETLLAARGEATPRQSLTEHVDEAYETMNRSLALASCARHGHQPHGCGGIR